MPNGSAVALALDPPDAPVAPAKPDAETIARIGIAVADAAQAVAGGCVDWLHDGRMSGDTRARAGDLFVRLYELQESTLGALDFDSIARREGRRVLAERRGTVLREAGLSGAALDRMLDEIVSWPLDVLAHITAAERALAH